jgi:hypothetical protein
MNSGKAEMAKATIVSVPIVYLIKKTFKTLTFKTVIKFNTIITTNLAKILNFLIKISFFELRAHR